MFKNLDIKIAYDSAKDDIVKSFFIPVLCNSINYKRVSAYYSSKSLKALSEGLSIMIWSGGTLNYIVSYIVSREDFDSIIVGRKNPKKIINDLFVKDMESLKNLMKEDSPAALAYLISKGSLTMKFVVTSNPIGIFHMKFGIFTDSNGDKISFSGSVNETIEGLENNVEEFKVFRSWIPEEEKYIIEDINKFDFYWNNNKSENYIVLDIPDETKNLLDELFREHSTLKKVIDIQKNQIFLRAYQAEALQKWIDNKYRGIIQIATGGGKTFVAISGIFETYKKSEKLLVIISVPTDVLVEQWNKEIKKYLAIENIVIFSSSNKDYKNKTYEQLKYFSNKDSGIMIIIGTHISLSKDFLDKEIALNYKGNIYFIVDEVHWLGAPNLSSSMKENYIYRMGLTATPIRAFDEEGTNKIVEYFNGIVYKYSLGRAINEGYLSKYLYYPRIVYLTKEEIYEYKKITSKFFKIANIHSVDKNDYAYNKFLIKRAKITKKAKNKILELENIINELKSKNKLNYLLIYFEDENHINEYIHIFKNYNIKYAIVDSNTSKENREIIFKRFNSGEIECILSMKILDEGIDLPLAKRAILLSSSTNPRQYIQRRGRVLRNNLAKNIAEIYDILAVVDINMLEEKLSSIEKKIVEKEIKRASYFALYSENMTESLSVLETVSRKFNISLYKFINDIKESEA